MNHPYTVVLIIPTGIGAAIGGYAGDALPVARAIASVCDRLITHPNVLNGAQLYWSMPNTLYVEGYGLDKFASSCWGLHPVRQNRIGLVLDRGIEPELQVRQLQAAEAARATLGLSLTDYVITDTPLNVQLRTSKSGASWGTVENPDSLLRAAKKLIDIGAEAIAVVARFPDDIDSLVLEQYRHGQGVDPLAGAEAVISHLIVRTFKIPCAHAPALLPLPIDPNISPRSAAEELGYTFLPSVLVGLSRAPRFTEDQRDIWAKEVDAVVVPTTACGGSAILSLSNSQAQIITVSNSTQMLVPPAPLGIKAIGVNSYLEAIGVLVAHKAGVDLASFNPTISPLNCLSVM